MLLRKSLMLVVISAVSLTNSGCIGTMIWASGEDFEFSKNTTSEKLTRKYGSPIKIDYLDPPAMPEEIPLLFSQHWPLDLQKKGPIARLETYRYVGPVEEHPDVVGMAAAIEVAWSLMTLGLYEFYNVPRMIAWRSEKMDDVTEFVVAFDINGQYVNVRILK